MKRIFTLALTAIMLATALTGCGKSDNVLHMATNHITEQYIMGNMIKDLIENQNDLTVELTEGVGGGVSNILPTMEKGEFDFYPEYTGTGWNAVLKEESLYQEAMFDQL